MSKLQRLFRWFVVFCILFSAVPIVYALNDSSVSEQVESQELIEEEQLPDVWIIHWSSEQFPLQDERLVILDQDTSIKTAKIGFQEVEGLPAITWQEIEDWRQLPTVSYLYPNKKLQLSTIDQESTSFLPEQRYLEMIHAKNAWALQSNASGVKVAVLDTGVDLEHPSLESVLLNGYNVIRSNEEPVDNYGHGTNVAGILGADHHNGIGFKGVASNLQLLPIKVLDGNGEGDEYNVAKGIYHAINARADIILLSLGDVIYSPSMEEAVREAEAKGVLVIASTGNEGSRVNYPASFPTVLAVGALDFNYRVPSFSNTGPEVDVVAPGQDIYTTEIGGGYGYHSGTSMAAPQVAGLAALIKAKHPEYTPRQIRELIKNTASPLTQSRWSHRSGYGLIHMERALLQGYPSVYEKNTEKNLALDLPVSTERVGRFDWGKSYWYKVQVPYTGQVNIKFNTLDHNLQINRSLQGTVQVDAYPVGRAASTFLQPANSTFSLWSEPGDLYIKLTPYANLLRNDSTYFLLENQFAIGPDAYEPNQTKKQAKRIRFGQTITGNFHLDNDHDWFYVDVPAAGELDLRVLPDSLRLDVVLEVHGPGLPKQGLKIDGGHIFNQQEEKKVLEVEPGRYYFDLYHYYGFAVNSQYTFKVQYRQYVQDLNEPNNVYSEATFIRVNQPIYGTIQNRFDVDWFTFYLAKDQEIYIRLNYPAAQSGQLVLFSNRLDSLSEASLAHRNGNLHLTKRLKAGKYYIRLQMNKPMKFERYQLQVSNNLFPFKDVEEHWAKDQILHLAEEDVIQGYADHTFHPDQGITRGEVAAALVRAGDLRPKTQVAASSFTDLDSSHWAYQAIATAYQHGIITGYPDHTFRADQTVTRAELVSMIVKMENLKLKKLVLSFPDIPRKHWATSAIRIMQSHGYVTGDEQGRFHPDVQMTRAEFVTIMERIWYQ